jgi:nucleoside-diphosphate-sugar epimerase
MARIVVTGTAGLLGRAVAAEFRSAGCDVLGLDRLATPDGEISDLSDVGALSGRFAGAACVVHCAAIAHLGAAPEATIFANNVSTSLNVLLAAETATVPRLVYASSQSALGLAYSPAVRAPDRIPVDETHPCRPVEAYGLSKLAGEQACEMVARRTGMRIAALRFPVIWSPDGFDAHVAKRLGNPAQGAKSQWAYVDVRDAARACRLASEGWAGDRFEIFNVASDRPFEFDATSSALADVYGHGVPIERHFRSGTAIFSSTKAREAFGFVSRFRWSRSGISEG